MKTCFPSFLLVGTTLWLSGCGGGGTATPEPAADVVPAVSQTVAVQVTPIVLDPAALPVRLSGRLTRRSEAVLSFKIGGVIADVKVRAGEAVQAGQELASLRLAEIDAQVAQARSGLAKAERDLARIQNLAAEQVATTENLQDAGTALDVAQAQLRIAEFNRRYAVITAPAAGRILRRTAEPEELSSPGKPVLTFAADGEGWLLTGGAADRTAANLAPGDGAQVAWNGATVAGRVLRVGDAVDPVTGMVPVEVLLAATPVGARSGSVAEAVLQPQAVTARPRVPAAAVQEGAGRRAYIFVIAPQTTTARRVDVELEALTEAGAFLRPQARLSAETAVVTSGAEFLVDGASVRVEQN